MDDQIPALDTGDVTMLLEDINSPPHSPLTPPEVVTPVHGSVGDELDVPDVIDTSSVPDVAADSLLDYESASSDPAVTSTDNTSHTSKLYSNTSHWKHFTTASTALTADTSNNDNFKACSDVPSASHAHRFSSSELFDLERTHISARSATDCLPPVLVKPLTLGIGSPSSQYGALNQWLTSKQDGFLKLCQTILNKHGNEIFPIRLPSTVELTEDNCMLHYLLTVAKYVNPNIGADIARAAVEFGYTHEKNGNAVNPVFFGVQHTPHFVSVSQNEYMEATRSYFGKDHVKFLLNRGLAYNTIIAGDRIDLAAIGPNLNWFTECELGSPSQVIAACKAVQLSNLVYGNEYVHLVLGGLSSAIAQERDTLIEGLANLSLTIDYAIANSLQANLTITLILPLSHPDGDDSRHGLKSVVNTQAFDLAKTHFPRIKLVNPNLFIRELADESSSYSLAFQRCIASRRYRNQNHIRFCMAWTRRALGAVSNKISNEILKFDHNTLPILFCMDDEEYLAAKEHPDKHILITGQGWLDVIHN